MDRVLSAIAELGFRRNDIARNLRSGRLNATVGLLIEEIANPFYATIASVAAEIAADHQTLLMTASSEEDVERERTLLVELCQRRVDGLLVVPAGQDHSYLRREVEMGMSVVFLDRPPGALEADTVLLDNRGGAQAAVDRLLADGHTRIGILIDSLAVYTMRERLAGARDALAAASVRYDERLIREHVKTPGRPADRVLRHQQPDHRRCAAGAVPPGQRRRPGRLRRLRAVAPDAAAGDGDRLRHPRACPHRHRTALPADQRRPVAAGDDGAADPAGRPGDQPLTPNDPGDGFDTRAGAVNLSN